MGNEADIWEYSPEHEDWVQLGETDEDEQYYLEKFNQRQLRQQRDTAVL